MGLRADLVLLDADPTTDSAVLRQPAAVWVAGVRAAHPGSGVGNAVAQRGSR